MQYKTLDEVVAADADFEKALSQAILVAAYKERAGEILRGLHAASHARDQALRTVRRRYGISHDGLLKMLNQGVADRWRMRGAI